MELPSSGYSGISVSFSFHPDVLDPGLCFLRSWELNSGSHACYTVQYYWVRASGTMVHSEFIFMTGIDTELFSFRFPFHSSVRVCVHAHMLAWGRGVFYFYPDSFVWREHIHRRPWFSDPAWDPPALQLSLFWFWPQNPLPYDILRRSGREEQSLYTVASTVCWWPAQVTG